MKSMLCRRLFLAGISCLVFLSTVAAESLPPTLKSERNQRSHYDWNARHEAVKRRNQSIKPEYVIIGDSITHRWAGEPSGDNKVVGKASWEKLFGPHAATNLGFGYDYVDNAYYRVQDGELDGISPRVIIVLLGTNNLGGRKDTPEACADNLKAFVHLVRRKCPSSKILLLGILPRKEKKLAPLIVRTNELISGLADGRMVFFANPGKEFLSENGSLRNELLMDGVHPSAKGYEVLGGELVPLLKKLDPKYRSPAPRNKTRS